MGKKLNDEDWIFTCNLNPEQVIDIWDELHLAHNGNANYGGHTSEIYSHRLVGFMPRVHLDSDTKLFPEDALKLYKTAGYNLLQLCRKFTLDYEAVITIEHHDEDNEPYWLNVWVMDELVLNHRCHVEVWNKNDR